MAGQVMAHLKFPAASNIAAAGGGTAQSSPPTTTIPLPISLSATPRISISAGRSEKASEIPAWESLILFLVARQFTKLSAAAPWLICSFGRDGGGGVMVLGSATSLWYLFERAGYNLISFASNVLLLLVVILFLWAKSASLLNRPLPPLPDLEISEESVGKVAGVVREAANYALCIAHDITIGRNFTAFIQVAFGLWLLSCVGSLVNFFTLAYIGVLLALSVPYIYDRYQDHINPHIRVVNSMIQTQCNSFNDIFNKIPLPSNKEKKIQ